MELCTQTKYNKAILVIKRKPRQIMIFRNTRIKLLYSTNAPQPPGESCTRKTTDTPRLHLPLARAHILHPARICENLRFNLRARARAGAIAQNWQSIIAPPRHLNLCPLARGHANLKRIIISLSSRITSSSHGSRALFVIKR